MWVQIKLLFGSLGKDRPPITIVENPQIQQLIKDKTRIDVESIKISESDRPQLFLSRELYNSFTPDEVEYVVLHEAGHYALAHSVKELLYDNRIKMAEEEKVRRGQ